jgi:hypothetical protein
MLAILGKEKKRKGSRVFAACACNRREICKQFRHIMREHCIRDRTPINAWNWYRENLQILRDMREHVSMMNTERRPMRESMQALASATPWP